MPLRDDLLTPISDDSPAGPSLRYDPVFDKVKEARREEADIPSGELPEGPRKTADYAVVIRLASDALATRSKDLQLAAWLTEALLGRDGFVGLAEGLGVLHGLLDQFWETVHPELDEDGDAGLRAAPLDWVGSRLVLALREVPLTRDGYGHLAFEESRDVGYESQASEGDKAQRRASKIAEGKLAAEDWDRSVETTDLAFYQRTVDALDAATAALEALETLSDERFGADAPSYTPLRETLTQVGSVARSILRKKLPPEPEAGVAGAENGAGDGAAGDGAGGGTAIGAMRRRGPDGPSLLELAMVEVRAGRSSRAVEMLMASAARGRSRRDRFLRRTAVARIMVDAGLYPVAVPLLEQLLGEIDDFKLEDWEPGAVVATPMSLLWRCYDRSEESRDWVTSKDALYPRICRLDPVQAIALTPGVD